MNILRDGKYCCQVANTPMWNLSENIIFDENTLKIMKYSTTLRKMYEIVDLNIIVPNKVVEVVFSDGTKEKAVCREPDIFRLDIAISICILKKIMGGSSVYNKAIKHGIKMYEDKQKREAAKKAEQERIMKKRVKKLEDRKRRAAKKAEAEKERQVEIQKEAYIKALEYIKNKESTIKK